MSAPDKRRLVTSSSRSPSSMKFDTVASRNSTSRNSRQRPPRRLLFRSSSFCRPEFSRGQSATAAGAAPPGVPGTRIHGRSTTSKVPAALPVPAGATRGKRTRCFNNRQHLRAAELQNNPAPLVRAKPKCKPWWPKCASGCAASTASSNAASPSTPQGSIAWPRTLQPRSPLSPQGSPHELPKRKDSCTFKREKLLEIQERILLALRAPQVYIRVIFILWLLTGSLAHLRERDVAATGKKGNRT